MGEGAELVESIFPHLDSIQQTSIGLHEALHACNRGHHPLTSLPECAHPSFVLQLLATLRDVQRRSWRSDSMTLYLSLQGSAGASQVCTPYFLPPNDLLLLTSYRPSTSYLLPPPPRSSARALCTATLPPRCACPRT